jgi:hypothetical protein
LLSWQCRGTAPIATEALTRIAALYRIEDDIRGLSPGERHAARQARSKPLTTRAEARNGTVLQSTPTRWLGLPRST